MNLVFSSTSGHARRRSPRFIDSSSYLPILLLNNNPRNLVDTFKSRSRLLSTQYSEQPLRLEVEAHIACMFVRRGEIRF